jgi:hypothetical protein
MRFRNLRIAWSVLCGIACVLLCVLWVRSYWWSDGAKVYHAPQRMAQLKSMGAAVHAYVGHYSGSESGLRIFSVPLSRIHQYAPFDWQPLPELRVSVPHYALLIALGTVSAVPWIRWRFSLRTLLIVTTLIAVVLGLIVYTLR